MRAVVVVLLVLGQLHKPSSPELFAGPGLLQIHREDPVHAVTCMRLSLERKQRERTCKIEEIYPENESSSSSSLPDGGGGKRERKSGE